MVKIHPKLKALLSEIKSNQKTETCNLTIAEARKSMAAFYRKTAGRKYDIGSVEDIFVNSVKSKVRIYKPPINLDHQLLPVLVYLHGGGWSLGDLETGDEYCRYICSEANCLVVSIDYPLAPDFKFPTSYRSVVNSLIWIFKNIEDFSGDKEKIAVCGESSGANLITSAVQEMTKDYAYSFSLQILFYPPVDLKLKTESKEKFSAGYGLSANSSNWFASLYLNSEDEKSNPIVSPLINDDLSFHPETLIIAAGLDILVDEGRLYAEKLSKHGVKVKYYCFDNMIHGFLGMPGIIDEAKDARKQSLDALINSWSR